MIRSALTDFSWLTIHSSSWLGLITKLLLLMAPNVSNGELSEGYILAHEGKKEVLGEGERVSYPFCMVFPLPLFLRNRNSKNKNIFNFTSVFVIIPRLHYCDLGMTVYINSSDKNTSAYCRSLWPRYLFVHTLVTWFFSV